MSEYLFHGTGEGAFRSILRNGLQPKNGKVYTSQDFLYALSYAERKGCPFGPRVMRVPKDSRWKEDQSNDGGDFISILPISVSCIEIFHKEKWTPLEKFEDPEIGIVLKKNKEPLGSSFNI